MLLGIDIGGTAIKSGLVNDDGTIVARLARPFDKSLSFDGLIALMADVVRELSRDTQATAIGVCLPGFVDSASGMLVDGGGNVPALREKPLAAALRETIGIPVHVANDGVAATQGEAQFGAGRGLKRFALMTIGTGIGGAVYIDGKVVTGSRGEPPEMGAIAIQRDDGSSATLESLACAAAFSERYRKYAGHSIADLPTLFARLGQDAAATRAIREISGIIARAFAPLVNALNLEACLIGGGVAGAGEPLIGAIRDQLPDFTWPMIARNCEVLQAKCGNDAGVLGAAWLARLSVAH
jgi:glucokinase